MSKHLQPALYNGKAMELQWVNFIYQSHDLICGCQSPITHLQDILRRDNNKQLCLPSPTDGDKDGEDPKDIDTGLEEGELDRLFAEDTGEDDG